MKKLKIFTKIPLSDEEIIANTPFEFEIDKKQFKINQFTYEKYFSFNNQLHLIGADVLSYPDDKIVKDEEIKDKWSKWIKTDNKRVYWLINLLLDFSVYKTTGLKKYLPVIIQKSMLKKFIIKNLLISDLLIIFENLLLFNFSIKKKLLKLLKTNPEQLQAEDMISETLKDLSPAHLALVKDGIMIPRYCN